MISNPTTYHNQTFDGDLGVDNGSTLDHCTVKGKIRALAGSWLTVENSDIGGIEFTAQTTPLYGHCFSALTLEKTKVNGSIDVIISMKDQPKPYVSTSYVDSKKEISFNCKSGADVTIFKSFNSDSGLRKQVVEITNANYPLDRDTVNNIQNYLPRIEFSPVGKVVDTKGAIVKINGKRFHTPEAKKNTAIETLPKCILLIRSEEDLTSKARFQGCKGKCVWKELT